MAFPSQFGIFLERSGRRFDISRFGLKFNPRTDRQPEMLATPELMHEAAQLARLGELLPRWRELPLYRNLPSGPEAPDRERLAEMPFITKRHLREGFPQNVLPTAGELEALLARNAVELEHTSGTTEERTPVLFRRGWWEEQEARVLRLNAFVARVLDEQPHARRATLTTPACNDRSCPVVWQSAARRTFGNSRFVNLARIPFVLEAAELRRMAEEIIEWAPVFLDLSPVHGARLALFCEANGLRFPSVRFILCSYEFTSVVHRRILQRVFGVPIFNLYGSTETGHLLMENEAGEMVASPDNAFLEVIHPDERGVGELVVTTLTNEYMPLLRYRIGDLVERREEPYRTVWRVHGRLRDALRGPGGRRVTTWDVDQCFADIGGILHYQLAQEESSASRLRYIPEGNGPSAAELATLAARLTPLLPAPGLIEVAAVNVLAPAHSGKFRLTAGV